MDYAHTPRKRFGQNFLVDDNICAEIIARVNPQIGQHIVEIGPGQGAITKGLVASGAQIDAIELDRDLAAILSTEYAKCKNFTLHSADILNFDLKTLVAGDNKRKLRLVGNLPYNISTPLLFKLFADMGLIADMHFMLQLEVAERLVAAHSTKEYGRMSVMAQYACTMQIVLAVPHTAFYPQPKVQSAIVRFIPHSQPAIKVDDLRQLQTVTTLAFNQRRKTIANALKVILAPADFIALNIDNKLRAENLCLEDYVRISNYMTSRK